MDVTMSKKRRLKKEIKSHVRQEVKAIHSEYRYAVLTAKYKLISSIIYVFDRNQTSRLLNGEMSAVGNMLFEECPAKFRDGLHFGSTDCYPNFDTSWYDIHHNVAYMSRDTRLSKKINSDQLSGKAFKALLRSYNRMVGDEPSFYEEMTPQELHKIVLRLYKRDLIVFTRFGSIWLKEDFKKLMKEQNLLWTEMVIDFTKIPLNNLMGAQ